MIATASHHNSIALKAYFTWEGEGSPHGRHDEHWFAAEASLARAAERKAAPATATATLVKSAPAKAAVAKKASPKAPAETVVAAAALATPRASRATSKAANGTH